MNSNIFSNPLSNQDAPIGDFAQEMASASWPNFESAASPNGFSTDGVAASEFSPGNSGAMNSQVPAGLLAAITAAIAQYFQNALGQFGSSENTTPFSNVTASSTGDPHDAISGTRCDGSAESRNWDDMQSRDDLLSAPGIAGGLRLSSTVGEPNAQGATMNASVTATANRGRTIISFNRDGKASVRDGNFAHVLSPNETVQLSPNLRVTDSGKSVSIFAHGENGAALNTTFTENGQNGVDLSAEGRNIALGGYLVNSAP